LRAPPPPRGARMATTTYFSRHPRRPSGDGPAPSFRARLATVHSGDVDGTAPARGARIGAHLVSPGDTPRHTAGRRLRLRNGPSRRAQTSQRLAICEAHGAARGALRASDVGDPPARP